MQGQPHTWTKDLSNIIWIIRVPSGLKEKKKQHKEEINK